MSQGENEGEKGRVREGEVKKLISQWHPFSAQQGKFLYYNGFWLIWSQLESY